MRTRTLKFPNLMELTFRNLYTYLKKKYKVTNVLIKRRGGTIFWAYFTVNY